MSDVTSDTGKPWYQSKTIIVNGLTFAGIIAAAAFKLDLGLDDQTKAEIATGIVAVVNIVLRIVTKQPVTT